MARVLLQTPNPSWLYQVERGATTVWETWEGFTGLGRAKESHNHYALGAVAGFLTEHVAGIASAAPGYRVIDIRPVIGGGLTHASAHVDTPYRTASSRWCLEGDTVVLEVTIPAGATARVRAGSRGLTAVGSGTHVFRWDAASLADQ